MTIEDVKQFLLNIVQMYHPNAMVVWSKTGGVKPKSPYISLSYSNLERSAFPIVDEAGDNYYNYSMIFEINLYTVGKQVRIGNQSYYENTAVEDLDEFVRFLDSEGITELTEKNNVAILKNSPIRDLSGLIGDAKFNYRSMAEFVVSWTDKASGKYGVQNRPEVPNSSGGGMSVFTEATIDFIEEVLITEGGNDNE